VRRAKTRVAGIISLESRKQHCLLGRTGWLKISGHVRKAHVRKHTTAHSVSKMASLSTSDDLSLFSENGKEPGSFVMDDDDESEQEVDCILLITDLVRISRLSCGVIGG
jgi:hypothetical protein